MQIGPFALPENFTLPERARFALVDNDGIVRSIILMVPGAPYDPPAGLGYVMCGDDVEIGDQHHGAGEFSKPVWPVDVATWGDVDAAMQRRIDAIASQRTQLNLITAMIARGGRHHMLEAWNDYLVEMRLARAALVGLDVRTINDDRHWPQIHESVIAFVARYV